jgi:hypothetical protein
MLSFWKELHQIKQKLEKLGSLSRASKWLLVFALLREGDGMEVAGRRRFESACGVSMPGSVGAREDNRKLTTRRVHVVHLFWNSDGMHENEEECGRSYDYIADVGATSNVLRFSFAHAM